MKPIAIVSTDWHIKAENSALSIDLMRQMISLASENKVSDLFCLGDVFDSRRAQPELTLNTFSKILDCIDEYGMKMTCIAGNHDKTDPNSETSYLTPFIGRENFRLITRWDKIVTERGNALWFLPYFREDRWIEECRAIIKAAESGHYKGNYLFSHQAVNGSVNNDGSSVSNHINNALLSAFEGAYFGHYHNYQQPTSLSFQMGAWKQSTFGEDTDKGFYIFYEDGNGNLDFNFIKSKFPEYITLKIDAETADKKALKKVLEMKEKSQDSHIRVVIRGNVDKVKSLSLKELEENGVKVQKDITLAEKDLEIKDFKKKDSMFSVFEEFCRINDYDYEEGKALLEGAY